MNDIWYEIVCEVPADLADFVAEYLIEISGNGVCMENLTVDAFSHSEINHPPVTTVSAYFSSVSEVHDSLSEIRSFIDGLAASHPSLIIPKPVISVLHSEDWSTSWQANFKPLRVGRRLLIVPSWEEVYPLPEDILLRIDPGMAFGTGGHETTRLCLELLEQIMDNMSFIAPTVLDLGTGSGILAMAAVRLGGGRVCGVDTDPTAIEVARVNIASNGLEKQIVLSTLPLESQIDRFDIILANILAEELVRLASHLTDKLNPGGMLVLSGILAEKEPLVLNGFASTHLIHMETRCEGEWLALLYQKGGAL